MSNENYDLIVIGHGAAGLAAAVTFVEETGGSGRVAVLERSPQDECGGATRWTGAFLRVDSEDRLDTRYVQTLEEVSGGRADVPYLERFSEEVPESMRFLEAHGVTIVRPGVPLPTTFTAGEVSMDSPAFPDGGGKAIVDALGAQLAGLENVDLLYETEAVKLTTSAEGRVNGVAVRGSDGLLRTIEAENVILANGGFEGNYEALVRYLGADAHSLTRIAPGIANNRGDGLRMALELGADTAGQFDGAHIEPIDPRATTADAVLYGYTSGIFVNQQAERFFDEGADTWDNTFEKVGRQIWRDQGNKAYWIADSKTLDIPGIEFLFVTPVPPEQADTLEELAATLGIDPTKLVGTVEEFNAAVSDDEFDPTVLDGKHTTGLSPNKSNWATPLDKPPFIAVPLTAAICFVYGGLRTDREARVLTPAGVPIAGLYAAGAVTGAYYNEYPPATSVLRALTFGRIAAVHAVSSRAAAATA